MLIYYPVHITGTQCDSTVTDKIVTKILVKNCKLIMKVLKKIKLWYFDLLVSDDSKYHYSNLILNYA